MALVVSSLLLLLIEVFVKVGQGHCREQVALFGALHFREEDSDQGMMANPVPYLPHLSAPTNSTRPM
eukprot:14798534-Ditylum_brightwellii.AAC.1